MDLENFIKEYEPFVKEWFIYNNWAKIDFKGFWQNFLIKMDKNNDFQKFSDSHESTAQFETWLKTVLKNYYTDQWRKLQSKSSSMHEKYESLSSDGSDFEEARVYNLHKEIEDAEDKQLGFDWNKISDYVNQIKDDTPRVIFKLKLFHQKYLPLTDKDYIYIEKRSNYSRNKIEQFLLDHQKQPFGMKNKDISALLNMKMGSISTTFTRVRILIESAYRELKG